MTYNVFSGTLNPLQSISQSIQSVSGLNANGKIFRAGILTSN